MKILPILVGLGLVSCAGSDEALVVKRFTLRDQDTNSGGDSLVAHEKKRRLYGAVSIEERKGRLGQYYTAIWKVPAGSSGKGEIVFAYLQGKSGSLVKFKKHDLPSGESRGKHDFTVIGDDFFENGRVLAWKMSLNMGGKTIATKQSFLWE